MYKRQAIDLLEFDYKYYDKIHGLMNEANLDYMNDEARNKFIADLNSGQKQALNYDSQNDMRDNVCRSIQNVNFVNKKPKYCEADEVSIDKISSAELAVIWLKVARLSNYITQEDDKTQEE